MITNYHYRQCIRASECGEEFLDARISSAEQNLESDSLLTQEIDLNEIGDEAENVDRQI